MLRILSTAAGGVLVLSRLRGMTIVELPLLLALRLRLPADAPRDNAGEASTGTARATAVWTVFFSTDVA